MSKPKRLFAQDTKVPVSRSRGEVDKLLRSWGCSAISWADDFSESTFTVRFRWAHQGDVFIAHLSLPAGKDEQSRRTAHRLLLLKIKADLNCVEAGLASAAEIWLPYLEHPTGGYTLKERLGHLGVKGLLDG